MYKISCIDYISDELIPANLNSVILFIISPLPSTAQPRPPPPPAASVCLFDLNAIN